jgi:hypothetical protein
VKPSRPDVVPASGEAEQQARAAMGYALIWPAAVLAFILSVLARSIFSGIVLFLVLAVVGLVGAIATVRTAGRARALSQPPLKLAIAAGVIGWIEISLTLLLSVWVVIDFVRFLEHETL